MTGCRPLMLLAACGLALAGCGAPSKQPAAPRGTGPWSTTQPIPPPAAPAQGARLTINDPCSTRLHDMCGPLLLYITTNYRLPARLDELRQLPGSEGLEFTCPVSKQPYVYNREGIVGPNIATRAVVYDPAPTHGGHRWAIIVKEATPNAPFIAEVVAWPESRFPK